MDNAEAIIVGGGISGLSLAYFLLKRNPELNLKLIEAEKKAGGKIITEKVSGFLCEGGVNGFLSNKPSTIALAKELNIEPIKGSESAKKRYILIDGKLKEVSSNPLKFFLSSLLSFSGKIRMIREYFIVPQKEEIDESVEQFVSRRVGREFYEKLIDAMSTGIYAGDPSRMSMKSCFPKVYFLEKKYGGLIKGLLALKKERKSVQAQPDTVLMSFKGGMLELINSLESKLEGRIIKGKKVIGCNYENGIYRVFLESGETIEAKKVIFACPAHDTSQILKDFDKELSDILNSIPYPPLSVVALGFKTDQIGFGTDLYGFLVPYKEKRKILGALFDSSIFTNRAPDGYVLLRTMIGGRRAPELALLPDEKLIDLALSELKEILKIKGEPNFIKIFRWGRAIPQYELGHEEKLRKIDQILKKYPGLYLTGNAYRGVSVNDCIENSLKLAEKI
ncbi:Protoporphyrinogen IX oxidase, aerobic, HemY [Thermodesulfovibrio sp. N1]|uniref:protoporphyrinogen oxidase n=1 Tax=unclassified Thermodesulfovibrio TaxID=2645936 RepID=UPI00083A1B53|nr:MULTISPECIES: protoporphyrinogen oxidase [unclassified Thermodesulfovibrio]MDI1472238.1 protoporphyrinogen oxidase [Thermodesulfovibrio sp. 1176]ODA44617.1 Protoporphyrinogen IX oxidase, aerobic, HemY [Thermodesulfovibrio sp. N1]